MKKLFYKLFSKAERALMMKDLSALCRRRLILTLLIALPLVFAVAFPLLFLFVSAMVSPESSGVEQFKNLLDNIPQGTDERAQMFYIFTAFISPMLFMLIPLLLLLFLLISQPPGILFILRLSAFIFGLTAVIIAAV